MPARWMPFAECLGLCLVALLPHLRIAALLARRTRAQRLLLFAMAEVLLLGVWLVVSALKDEPEPRWIALVFGLVALLPGACLLGAAELVALRNRLSPTRSAIAAITLACGLYLLFPPDDCLFLAIGACDEPMLALIAIGLSAPALGMAAGSLVPARE